MVFGTAAIPMRAEWLQTSFVFGAPKEELAYGLRSPRNATRGLLSVVQGFVLKYLLFARKTSRVASLTECVSISVYAFRLGFAECLCVFLFQPAPGHRRYAEGGLVLRPLGDTAHHFGQGQGHHGADVGGRGVRGPQRLLFS